MKLSKLMKSLVKPLILFTLILTLVFSQSGDALAATRGGGRIGGGNFRAPSRTYNPPSRSYQPPSGGYYPYPGGGGFGFPFIVPIFGIGGGFGGLFTILIFISIASFLVRSFRRSVDTDYSDSDSYGGTSTVSLTRLQIGLLANARSLQSDLNRIAQTADTGSSEGLTQVLQETTLSLLRHPEYWVYAGCENRQSSLTAAEAQFNQLALAERSKFSEETLSNVNNQLRQAQSRAELPSSGDLAQQLPDAVAEYIVVTLLVAAQGKLQLPAINNTEDVRRALAQIGSVSSDQLLAVEVLWTPQAEGETLSADDMISEYPNLKLV
jgi:uncharacterized membrane protein